MNESFHYKEKLIIVILVITIFPILLIFFISIYSNEVYASPDNNTMNVNPNWHLPPSLDRDDLFAHLFAPKAKIISAFGGTKGEVPYGGTLYRGALGSDKGDITLTIQVSYIGRETGAFCYLDGKRYLGGTLCTSDGKLYVPFGPVEIRYYTIDTSHSLNPTLVQDLGWHEFKVELFNILDSKITSIAIWKWQTVKAFYLY